MEILSLNKTVRILDLVIDVDDKFNIQDIFKIKKFLQFYQHPDIELSIIVNFIDARQSLKDLTSLLMDIPQSKRIIRSFSNNIDGALAEFIIQTYNEIVILKSDDFTSTDDNILYFVSRQFPVIVEYIVDEKNNSIFNFKNFYDILSVRNTYKIDYFGNINNKKEYVEKIINELNRNSFITDPMKSIVLSGGNISHQKNYPSIVDDSFKIVTEKFNQILEKKNLKKCKGCIALPTCNGGSYAVFEQSNNSDVFCAINMGLVYLKNKLLSGGYKHEENDCRM